MRTAHHIKLEIKPGDIVYFISIVGKELTKGEVEKVKLVTIITKSGVAEYDSNQKVCLFGNWYGLKEVSKNIEDLIKNKLEN